MSKCSTTSHSGGARMLKTSCQIGKHLERARKLIILHVNIQFLFQFYAFVGQMSAFQELKKEIRVLEKIFHPKHELFRVKANGLDELSCRFVGANGEQFVIHCNIYVSSLKRINFVLLRCFVVRLNGEGY